MTPQIAAAIAAAAAMPYVPVTNDEKLWPAKKLRRYTSDDARAFNKRIKKRRAKKGYK